MEWQYSHALVHGSRIYEYIRDIPIDYLSSIDGFAKNRKIFPYS